jgi:hypothetical protein
MIIMSDTDRPDLHLFPEYVSRLFQIAHEAN